MKVIKRNGSEVEFDRDKIRNAIVSANNEVDEAYRLSEGTIDFLVDMIVGKCKKYDRSLNVEEIQEFVETEIMAVGSYEVAKCYIRYRYDRKLKREQNTTDAAILSLIERNNEQ